MKRVLITGITGFAGSHLADHLQSIGKYDIFGTYLDDSSLRNIPLENKISLHKLNLLDKKNTEKLIISVKPDLIFHLAALTSPKDSFENPSETFVNNVSPQITILETIKKNNFNTRILIVSSAEIYGIVEKKDLPIDEKTSFNPTNPYAVSKLAQDFLGLQSFLSDKLKVIRVRPFNHIGPRQSPSFVVSAFAKRIAEVEKGKEKTVKVGNLTSKRDFTDVRDMVKAYRLAIEGGDEGEVYNIGSGVSLEISKVLEMIANLSSTKIYTEEDPSLIRPSDNPEFVCDYSKFQGKTGWKPEIPIEKSLSDTLDYWRSIV